MFNNQRDASARSRMILVLSTLCLVLVVGWLEAGSGPDGSSPALDTEAQAAKEEYRRLLAVADGYPPRIEGEAERTKAIATWNRLEARLKTLVNAEPENLQLRLALADTYRLGHNLDIKGANDAAVATFEDCLERDPANVLANALLGRHFTYSGRFAEGRRYLIAAYQLAIEDALASEILRDLLSACYFDQRWAEAYEIGLAVEQAFPENQGVKAMIARAATAMSGGEAPKVVEIEMTDDAPPIGVGDGRIPVRAGRLVALLEARAEKRIDDALVFTVDADEYSKLDGDSDLGPAIALARSTMAPAVAVIITQVDLLGWVLFDETGPASIRFGTNATEVLAAPDLPIEKGSLEGLAHNRQSEQVWAVADDGTDVEAQHVLTTHAEADRQEPDVDCLGGVAKEDEGAVAACSRSLHGAQRNLTEARRWCQLAAEEGDASSQVLLAQILETGEDAPADLEGAFHWYWVAAEQNHPHAQLKAGLMLAQGKGCEADGSAGTELIRLSADSGYLKALEIVRQIAIARHEEAERESDQ